MRRRLIPLPVGTVDDTGHRYGRLVVLEYAGREEPNGHAQWLCRCTCGELPIVRGTRLRQGLQVSCGCWRADHDVRQAARLKVPAKERKAIAAKGGAATVGVPRKPRAQ